MGSRTIKIDRIMLHISIDSQNFERGMAQLLHNVENRRPITASLATELLSMTEDNFASESWGGQAWKQSQRAQREQGKTLAPNTPTTLRVSVQTNHIAQFIISVDKQGAITKSAFLLAHTCLSIVQAIYKAVVKSVY